MKTSRLVALSGAALCAALGLVQSAAGARDGVGVHRSGGIMKKIAAVLTAVLVLAVWAIHYRPITVAGAAPMPGPYPIAPKIEGLRLHVFNTGQNRMGSVLVGSERPWRPAPAFLIEHPRQGLVVFDTGLSPAVAKSGDAALPLPDRWFYESRGAEGRTLDVQLRAAGFDPAKVRYVVISHYHGDHIGTVDAFSNAKILSGGGRWHSIAFGDALPPFDRHHDLFGDGSVQLIAGAGHTKEDVMALVALPGGPALLSGDAVVHFDWLVGNDVQRIAHDPERAADVRNQVRAFLAAQPSVVLFPGHDLSKVPTDRADIVLHHPEWFGTSTWPISP